MTYRIAVASSDGKVVNQHFGHCRQFIIFEVSDTGEWKVKETRNTIPPCSSGEHSYSSLYRAIKEISDCSFVVVSQIGYGAEQALLQAGITVFVIPDMIYSALNKIVSSLLPEQVKLKINL